MQGWRGDGGRSAGSNAGSRSDPNSSQLGHDGSGRVIGYALCALSGAVVGFLFSGAFSLALFSFLALLCGIAIGWTARGLVP